MSRSAIPPCLEAALSYLQRGWSAIPLCPPSHDCSNPGKVPHYPWQSYTERLAREQELRLLWNRNRASNVGIVMGPVSGLLGLDVDGEQGEELLEDLCDDILPQTLEFSTPGGGRRLLFQHPDQPIPIRSLRIDGAEAIRVLGHGSQTAAPPSVHENGGVYRWVEGREPWSIQAQPIPPGLLAALLEDGQGGGGGSLRGEGDGSREGGAARINQQSARFSPRTARDVLRRAVAYLRACDPAISGSGGHNQTFKVAVRLVRGFALDTDTALGLLLSEYNPRCVPPWSERELRHKVESASRAPQEAGFMLNGNSDDNNARDNHARNGHQNHAPEAILRPFSSLEPRPVEWLWSNWLPLGKLAVLDGDPGLGKSTLLLDLAARVSRDGRMPDGSQGASGHVAVMSAEDAAEDTILPRLIVAEANLNRVLDLSSVRKGDEERPPEIPNDLPRIEAKLAECDCRLLVIDPLMAFLYGADANKDQEIRRVLFKLSKIAEKHRCAVIAMRHLNKGGGTKAIYRGNSSIGVIGHARTGLMVAVDPDDEHKRVLAVSKCNLAARPRSLRYTLTPIGPVCRVEWCGTSEYDADTLMQPPPTEEEREQREEARSRVAQAMDTLRMILESGPVRIREAKRLCADAGFPVRTTERAARNLGLTVDHRYEQGEHVWMWSLPLGEDGEEPVSSLYPEET